MRYKLQGADELIERWEVHINNTPLGSVPWLYFSLPNGELRNLSIYNRDNAGGLLVVL